MDKSIKKYQASPHVPLPVITSVAIHLHIDQTCHTCETTRHYR